MELRKLSTEQTLAIKTKYNLPILAAKVLASKQLCDEEIDDILKEPKLSNPYDATNIDKVIQRLELAKQRQEKVMVCGDYDCDGICATAILVDTLTKYGIQNGFYIPNRFKEGYGLHEHTVELAYQKGYTLLITVDNGVKAHAALKKAKQLQLDVIVSDHHTIEEDVECDILLHPSFMDDVFSTLSGAGVALLISRALLGDIKEHIALACVAAIGDVMRVFKETRAIIKLGLQYLNEGIMLPIQRLKDDSQPWTTQTIGFQIVPKLNAVGRLADRANVNNIVRYLLCHSLIDIQKMAQQINEINQMRKELSEQMIKKAKSLVQPQEKFQLLLDDSFHEGLNGIVAGKICDDKQQPVLVASRHQNEYKGSIRSIDGVDLRTFFQDCSFLQAYGGHEKAAGIAFLADDIPLLKQYIQEKMSHIYVHPEKKYDVVEVRNRNLSIENIESLACLMPFGEGFEEPIFLLENQEIYSKMLIKEKHSKWILKDNIEAIQFNARTAKEYAQEKNIHFIGTLEVSSFRQQKKINLKVKEVWV